MHDISCPENKSLIRRSNVLEEKSVCCFMILTKKQASKSCLNMNSFIDEEPYCAIIYRHTN